MAETESLTFTVSEAARVLGISRTTAYECVRTGELRAVRLGRRLVNECEAFARSAGYRRIRLWTQSNLLAARALYASAGYRLVATEPHTSFGKRLVGENWEMAL